LQFIPRFSRLQPDFEWFMTDADASRDLSMQWGNGIVMPQGSRHFTAHNMV
jgi:hypothetical protein